MTMIEKKPEKDFPPARPVARSPRGGPTMGRPAEWRPELVELADDSVSSTDATIPSSPRGARPMTGSTEAACTPRLCRGDGRGLRECKTSQRKTSNHTRIGADPGDAEERRATEPRAARPGRAPQDHRGVTQLMPWRRARWKKENSGRLNERVTEKIKARAWRNKSKRNKSKR